MCIVCICIVLGDVVVDADGDESNGDAGAPRARSLSSGLFGEFIGVMSGDKPVIGDGE